MKCMLQQHRKLLRSTVSSILQPRKRSSVWHVMHLSTGVQQGSGSCANTLLVNQRQVTTMQP